MRNIKVTGILGSPNRKGNTFQLLSELLSSAEQADAQTELIVLADYNIRDCKGCNTCVRTKTCPQWDTDEFKKVIEKVLDSDVVVFSSPSYGGGVPSLMKRFLDRCRLMRMQDFKLKNKIAAFVTTAGLRSGGQELVAVSLINFALMEGMIVVGECSQPIKIAPCAHGAMQTDTGWRNVKNDPVAVEASIALGKRVVEISALLNQKI